MRSFRFRTLVATAGAFVLPLLALAYLSGLPGEPSVGVIVLKVGLMIGGIVLFGLFLARLVEQMNAARVARWLESPEGKEWVDELPDEEREAFFENYNRLN